MFSIATAKRFASTSMSRTLRRLNLSFLGLLVACTGLIMCCGCGDSLDPVEANTEVGSKPDSRTPEAGPGTPDPLTDLLRLAQTSDMDAAIEQFVASSPKNWLDATSLEEFRISEADFTSLDRADRNRLQQKAIDRVGEIKLFARTVIDQATEAKNRGDGATAQRYVEAVRQFGRQLRDSDTLIVFQQTGNALSNASLPK